MLLILLFVATPPPFSFPAQRPTAATASAPVTLPQDPEVETLTAVELVELGRAQLEEGDASGAAHSFAEAYRRRPRLLGVKKQWAQALLILSAQRQKLGDIAGERKYYLQAVDVDPSLADDPTYVQGYKTVNLPAAGNDGKAFTSLKATRWPSRQRKYLGLHLGADLMAPVGLGINAIIIEHIDLRLTFDTLFFGAVISTRAIFLKSDWSPYAGIGGRFSFNPDPLGALHQTHAFFVDLGVQYAHPSGFFLDLGVIWAPPYLRASAMNDVAIPLPKIALGWNFGW